MVSGTDACAIAAPVETQTNARVVFVDGATAAE
jgi:hypothetical protein